MELSAVPSKRKKYLTEIGKLLSRKHGKKQSYRIKAIQLACDKSTYSKDFGPHNFAWIVCAFASEKEFNQYYENIEVVFDYDKMRSSMLRGTSYEDVLNSKNASVNKKFDMNDVSVDNLIDPTIIG